METYYVHAVGPMNALFAFADPQDMAMAAHLATCTTAVIAVITAAYAFLSLRQVRQNSLETKRHAILVSTLEQCIPLVNEIKSLYKQFEVQVDQSKPKKKGSDSASLVQDLLSQWERVATGVYVGTFNAVALYLWIGPTLEKQYPQLARYIRQKRAEKKDYYNQLETLVNRFNEIKTSRYEISWSTIRKLRRQYVPKEVIKTVKCMRRRTYKDLANFDSQLQYCAERRGVPIEFYRATIISAAQLPAVTIDEYSPDAVKETEWTIPHLLSKWKNMHFRNRIVEMYKKMHEATLGVYPPGFVRTDLIRSDKLDAEIGPHSHRFVVWQRPSQKRTRWWDFILGTMYDAVGAKGRIIGHIALEFLDKSKQRKKELAEILVKLNGAEVEPARPVEFNKCVAIVDLFHDSKFAQENNINSRGLVRRLLRRAIEAVEEEHGDFEGHWQFGTCISPDSIDKVDNVDEKKKRKQKVRLGNVEGIMKSEGGRKFDTIVCQPPNRAEGVDVGIWLFSHVFSDDPWIEDFGPSTSEDPRVATLQALAEQWPDENTLALLEAQVDSFDEEWLRSEIETTIESLRAKLRANEPRSGSAT